jgi:ABC-type lipoprotein export system ATPase subunit
MTIKKITILGGYDKSGEKDPVDRLDLQMGDVLSIVGPTGSGKTALINDIGLFANNNTPSRRRILVNGVVPSAEFLDDPAKNPIALITQHTGFLTDLPVYKFLDIHARIRHSSRRESTVADTLEFANQLTGEPIIIDSAMTELSGGQSRALLIADAVIIGHSPILLLDEIENAGINRTRALELLRKHEKIFIFVTHDPRIALFSDYRIVMKGGAMQDVITGGAEEKRVAEKILRLDKIMGDLREKIRTGHRLAEDEFKEIVELANLASK